MKLNKIKLSGFTLVELIVVITILAVLGTLGFMSFQGYSKTARDSVRLSDLTTISKALEFERTKNDILPLPDDYITITASGIILTYQGKTGSESMGQIGISEEIIDPLDGEAYIYTVNKNKTEYQLLGYLEGELSINNYANKVFADKSTRNLIHKGKKLGIILKADTGEVLDKSIVGNSFDIYVADNNYKVIFGNKSDEQQIFTDNNRQELAYYNSRSCKAIYEFGAHDGDKIYTIYPSGISVETYCDMTSGGREVRNFRTFDGVNDYMEIPELTSNGNFEIEIDATIPGGTTARTLFSSNSLEQEDTIVIDVSGNTIRAFTYVGNSVQPIIAINKTVYTDGKLHNLRLLYKAGVASFFMNDSLISTRLWNLNGNQKISTIGRRGGGNYRYWKGIIANVNFKSGWTQNGVVEANPYYRLDDAGDIVKNSNTKLGGELLTQNDLSGETDTWSFTHNSDINSSITKVSNGLRIQSTGMSAHIGQNIITEATSQYLLEIVSANNIGSLRPLFNGVNILPGGSNSELLQLVLGSVTSGSKLLRISRHSSSGGTDIVVKNASIKKAQGYGTYKNFSYSSIEKFTEDIDGNWLGKELIVGGNCSEQGIWQTDATMSFVNGKCSFLNTNSAFFHQIHQFVVGASYRSEYDININGGQSFRMPYDGNIANIQMATQGHNIFDFIAKSNLNGVFMGYPYNFDGDIDNISLKKVLLKP